MGSEHDYPQFLFKGSKDNPDLNKVHSKDAHVEAEKDGWKTFEKFHGEHSDEKEPKKKPKKD